MVTLYKNGTYKIFGYEKTDELIIHNTVKPFETGHTHVKNYNTAIWLINLAKHKRIPNRKSKFFIDCLLRISNDKDYITRLQNIKKHIK